MTDAVRDSPEDCSGIANTTPSCRDGGKRRIAARWPLHVRPESFVGLCLGIRLEFRLHPSARARFDLVPRSRRCVSPHPVQGPRHIVGKLRDVSDWAKTDLHLDMPAGNGRFRLVPNRKKVDLCDPMLDAPNREKPITI